MKHFVLIYILLITSISISYAQVDDPQGKPFKETKTLFGKNSKIRGFFSLDAQGTEIKSEPTLLAGVHGGMIINNHFILGIGGYGITTRTSFEENAPSELQNFEYDVEINGGYGGLLLGFIIAPREAIHISFPVIIGAGGLHVEDRDFYFYDSHSGYYHKSNTSAFFVVEPAAEIEFNITKFFKFGIRGSYRFTEELDLEKVSKNDFDNYNVGISFKFGKF